MSAGFCVSLHGYNDSDSVQVGDYILYGHMFLWKYARMVMCIKERVCRYGWHNAKWSETSLPFVEIAAELFRLPQKPAIQSKLVAFIV